jgi:molybdate transport system substrate-binding protein
VRRRSLRSLAAGVAVLVLAGCSSSGSASTADEEDALLVAAASDLRPAFEELGERYAAGGGGQVTFDFGSSGQLAQRIREGAPFDVFASADVAYVDDVVGAGIGDAETQRTYAYGRLVIWTPEDRWAGWEDLTDLAADGDITNLAIANPDHAPYGRAAREALVTTGVLDAVQDRLVLGENISDTQRLVETGNADVGIIALSLAIAAEERGVGRWVEVDADLHDPLQQDLVVTATDPARTAAARAFVDLVDSDAGREVMRRYGFVIPGEGIDGGAAVP